MRHASNYQLRILYLSALLFLFGCATPRVTAVDLHSAGPSDLAKLNREISGKRVSVSFVDGTKTSVRDVFVTSDSVMAYTSWSEPRGWPLDQVNSLRTTDQRPVIAGILGGAALGTLAGALLGKADAARNDCNGDTNPFCGLADGMSVLGGAMAGFLAGALIGGASASPKATDYVLADSTDWLPSTEKPDSTSITRIRR